MISKLKDVVFLFFFAVTTHGQEITFDNFLSRLHEQFESLGLEETKILSVKDSMLLSARLNHIGLYHTTIDTIKIGKGFFLNNQFKYLNHFESKDGNIHFAYYEHEDDLQSFIKVLKVAGLKSSIESYLQTIHFITIDSVNHSSLNAMYFMDHYAAIITVKLPFIFKGYDKGKTKELVLLRKGYDEITQVTKILQDIMMTDYGKLCVSKFENGVLSTFTPHQRLAGFFRFWTEVNNHFAFFENVPDLNWDKVLIENIPKVQADQTNLEYYRLLQKICALLKDGHTNVEVPPFIESDVFRCSIQLKDFDDAVYVVGHSNYYKDIMPIGTVIISINSLKVDQYLERYITPYISTSTDHIRKKMSLNNLLSFHPDSSLNIEIKLPNQTYKNVLLKAVDDEDPTQKREYRPIFKIEEMDNVLYMQLNDFSDKTIVQQFEEKLEVIKNAKKIILDLRNNGGGNSDYAYDILRHLVGKPIITSAWSTREQRSAFKAWGSGILRPISKEEKYCFDAQKGNNWYRGSPDTIAPHNNRGLNADIVLLIGNMTASAAEDFLIGAEHSGLTETIGDYTYGSTGQPLYIHLPGNGKARICTKKDTYGDGRPFVGIGIKPKYIIKPNLNEYLSKKDVELQKALTILNGK